VQHGRPPATPVMPALSLPATSTEVLVGESWNCVGRIRPLANGGAHISPCRLGWRGSGVAPGYAPPCTLGSAHASSRVFMRVSTSRRRGNWPLHRTHIRGLHTLIPSVHSGCEDRPQSEWPREGSDHAANRHVLAAEVSTGGRTQSHESRAFARFRRERDAPPPTVTVLGVSAASALCRLPPIATGCVR
jgi:hypothetical protein